jgi:hypothetical protein
MLLAVQSTNLVVNNRTADNARDAMAEEGTATTIPACWGSYSCGPATGILGYYVNIPDVRECARECNNNARCGHFTYFSVGMLEHVCFLFSACERRNYLCQGACASGPRCSGCAPCSNSANRRWAAGGGGSGEDGDADIHYGKRRLNILRATRR